MEVVWFGAPKFTQDKNAVPVFFFLRRKEKSQPSKYYFLFFFFSPHEPASLFFLTHKEVVRRLCTLQNALHMIQSCTV